MDGQTGTVVGNPSLVHSGQGTLGAKRADADGNGDYWTFTPTQDFNGTVDLSFDVTDGTTSVAASASLTVDPQDDLPVVTLPATVTGK